MGRLRERWLSGAWVVRRARVGLIVAMSGANVIGACIVFGLAAFVVPGEGLPDDPGVVIVNVIAAGTYLLLALPLGVYLGTRPFGGAERWLARPTRAQAVAVLRGPRYLAFVIGALWATAVAVFGALNLVLESLRDAIEVAVVVAFGGITTSAIAFLLAERILREAAGRVLQQLGEPPRVGLGVAMRALLTWALGTGVPVLGLVLLGIAALAGAGGTRTGLAVAMVALGGVALAIGLLATAVSARTTADPIVSVRRALREVQSGNLDVSVPVYDGTEVGQLQAGVNRMVAGLRERERLRDLFGRHVGEDVARAALERGVDLGGEVTDAAVLFADITGSTRLAEGRPPDEVVTLLNRFFAVVVEVVEDHGGSVNKFEGDAALAVFGAPAPLPDAPGSALAAARTLVARLRVELAELDLGVGVSGGRLVAGNVGAAHRFEFTVIGDPVNEAARLTDVAKGLEGRVAAAWPLVERAGAAERERWEAAQEVTLRGRAEPTRVAVPRAGTFAA